MEEKILDILEEICGDEVVKEDRDINLLEEDLMDSLDYTEITREEMDTPNKIINVVRSRM